MRTRVNTHMGYKFTRIMRKKGVTPSELAIRLNLSVQEVYKLLRQETIEQIFIEQISGILHYNPNNDELLEEDIDSKLSEPVDVEKLRQENEEMKKELVYLKEINQLLKGNKE